MPIRLSPRRVYTSLAVGLLIEAAVAAGVGSVTLDDHPAWHAIGLVPLVAPFVVGFAERLWSAILALEAATLLSFVAWWFGYGHCMRNTPLCQTCGTCCEGGALLLFAGFPMFCGIALVAFPLIALCVRGVVVAWERFTRRA